MRYRKKPLVKVAIEVWRFRRKIWRLQGMHYDALQKKYIVKKFNILTYIDNGLARIERLMEMF